MTKTKARDLATARMAQTGQAYSIVQVRNGQWMVERTSFVKDDPRGRIIYGGRPVEHLGKEREKDAAWESEARLRNMEGYGDYEGPRNWP